MYNGSLLLDIDLTNYDLQAENTKMSGRMCCCSPQNKGMTNNENSDKDLLKTRIGSDGLV